MLTSEAVLKKISENRGVIEGYGVKNIGLFGSYAQGTQKKSSDVDILVEFEEGKKTFDNYMELKLFLEDLLNREIDLVTRQSLKPDLKPYIHKSVKYAPKL